MIEFTAEAQAQIDDLRAHWLEKNWIEPILRLERALSAALVRIARDPQAGLPAPRPYPELARAGEAWVHEHRYWIAYTLTTPPKVLGVFDERADIPGRYRPAR